MATKIDIPVMPMIFLAAAAVAYNTMDKEFKDPIDRAVTSAVVATGSMVGGYLGSAAGLALGFGGMLGFRAARINLREVFPVVAGVGSEAALIAATVGGAAVGTYYGYDLTKDWVAEEMGGAPAAETSAIESKAPRFVAHIPSTGETFKVAI